MVSMIRFNHVEDCYRWRQHYESKVLHNNEVADFQWPTIPQKPVILITTLTKCHSPFQYTSFDTFKAKIGRSFAPQSTFEFP